MDREGGSRRGHPLECRLILLAQVVQVEVEDSERPVEPPLVGPQYLGNCRGASPTQPVAVQVEVAERVVRAQSAAQRDRPFVLPLGASQQGVSCQFIEG